MTLSALTPGPSGAASDTAYSRARSEAGESVSFTSPWNRWTVSIQGDGYLVKDTQEGGHKSLFRLPLQLTSLPRDLR